MAYYLLSIIIYKYYYSLSPTEILPFNMPFNVVILRTFTHEMTYASKRGNSHTIS